MTPRNRIIASIVVVVALAGGATAVVLALRDSKPGPAPRTTATLGWGTSTDGVLTVKTAPNAQKVIRPVMTEGKITLDVNAPPRAVDMLLTTDPSSNDAPNENAPNENATDGAPAETDWQPVTDTATIALPDAGYQMVFARFRDAQKSESPLSVVGVDNDPTFDIATTSPRAPTSVGAASPDVLEITIENGRVELGGVGRDDQLIGFIDGLPELADRPWTVSSGQDGAFATPTPTSAVHRVTRANGAGSAGKTPLVPVIHDFYLELPKPMTVGSTYQITPPSDIVAPITFQFGATSPSSSVHANQVGYDPSDPVKIGHLSAWMGSAGGITFDDPVGFTVRGDDDAEVFRGVARRRVIPAGGEWGRGDLTGSPVWELDFSSVATVGTFRLCVDLVGCSDRFAIRPGSWARIADGVARAMYHQRSGTGIGPPYSAIARKAARPKSPEPRVFQSTYTLLAAQEVEGDAVFEKLTSGRTTELVPGAWGGHFDAGDWDRRIQHLFYVRSAIDLVGLYPSLYGTLSLNIPESGNKIPDVLDEALWTLDLFQRLQDTDGGVRGGIESTGHPKADVTSWTDTEELFAYAPDPWSTYIYAATAAQMSIALRTYDSERAAALAESAGRAMAWAEARPYKGFGVESVTAQRATAAASMLRLTGDPKWASVFDQSTPFRSGPVENLGCHTNELCDAAWEYSKLSGTTDPAVTPDPTVLGNITASFVTTGNNIVAGAATTGFGWTLEHPENPLVWGLGVGGTPKTTGLLRAFHVTGDSKYLASAYRDASISLGDNPSNTSFITGFGSHPIRDPLIVDSFEARIPVWPGTPVYGNHELSSDQNWVQEFFLGPAGVTPSGFDVPYLWSNFDIHNVAPMSEFTVYQSHGPSLFAFGSLAGEAKNSEAAGSPTGG